MSGYRHSQYNNIYSDTLHQLLAESEADDIILLTAVARLDYVKNIEMLVRASIILMESNLTLRFFIIGDSREEGERRKRLQNMIPQHLQEKYIIQPKLPANALCKFLLKLKKKGIFVCTSRYETLGITPLQAALAGVYTLMSAIDSVEVALYFSDEDRFAYDDNALVHKIKQTIASGNYKHDTQKQYINNIFSTATSCHSAYKAWHTMTLYIESKTAIM